MSVIKSHDCKMCGGPLEIDLDRQVYRCNYCGISYDYEYFREDNVAEVAKTALERSEFGAAEDAYEFILKKDPHDFVALRGMILCSCKWKSIHPILHMSRVHLKSDSAELNAAIEKCLPEHKEYFLSIAELLGLLDSYMKLREEVNAIDEKKRSEMHICNSILDEKTANDSRFTRFLDRLFNHGDEEKAAAAFVNSIILAAGIPICLTIIFGFWLLFVILAAIAMIIAAYNIRKTQINKRLDKEYMPHADKKKRLSDELDVKSKEADDVKTLYMKKAKALVLLDNEFTNG